jgi:hypothetical protein
MEQICLLCSLRRCAKFLFNSFDTVARSLDYRFIDAMRLVREIDQKLVEGIPSFHCLVEPAVFCIPEGSFHH